MSRYVYYNGKKIERSQFESDIGKNVVLERNKETGLVDTYVDGKKTGSVVTMGDLIVKDE